MGELLELVEDQDGRYMILFPTVTVADPGKNLTGALHFRFGRGGYGGRG